MALLDSNKKIGQDKLGNEITIGSLLENSSATAAAEELGIKSPIIGFIGNTGVILLGIVLIVSALFLGYQYTGE